MSPGAVWYYLQSQPSRLWRELLTLGVFVWIALLALASILAYRAGPNWGLELAESPAGSGAVVVQVRSDGVADLEAIRPGDLVLLADGRDARLVIGQDLSTVRELTVVGSDGTVRSVRPPTLPSPAVFLLVLGALLFVGIGALVCRWAADPLLGLTFLGFSGSFATGLVAMPGAVLGHAWQNFLAAVAATVAAPAFLALFLRFPRPLSASPWLARLLVGATLALVGALAFFFLTAETTPRELNTVLTGWLGGNLLGGLLLLTVRAVRSSERLTLAPIVVGAAIGLVPLLILFALPRVIVGTPLLRADSAAVPLGVIPLAFAYAILRHRLFALDALLRRALIPTVAALAGLALFALVWETLLLLRLDNELAVVLAVAGALLLAPRIWRQSERLLDALLYPSMHQALAELPVGAAETTAGIAAAAAARVRQLVPTRWSACLVRDPAATPDEGFWQPLGRDGLSPGDLTDRLDRSGAPTTDAADRFTTLPVVHAGETIATLAVGPRLDGEPLSSLDREIIRRIAEQIAAPLDAALLRLRAEDEARFRVGLSRLARDLASAGTMQEVVRVTAQHAAQLLHADRAAAWLRLPQQPGFSPVAEQEPPPAAGALERLLPPDAVEQLSRERVLRLAGPPESNRLAGDGPTLLCLVGEPGGAEALVLVVRAAGRRPFLRLDEQRAHDVADHTDRALRRAYASAQAVELETLRELNQFKNDILHAVSHDLRNPLAVISGFAELLEWQASELTPEQLVELAREVLQATQAGRRLVDDLLTAARAERGKLTLQAQPVDLQGLLEQLGHRYHALPGGSRIEVVAPESVWVYADPDRLEQMIGNLVQNALRYAPHGPITLSARTTGLAEVQIEVRDQGPGIPLEEQRHVWEKFHRAAGGTRVSGGTGIGLAVVKTLAELHQGRVELESAPGQGSAFRIVLPTLASGVGKFELHGDAA